MTPCVVDSPVSNKNLICINEIPSFKTSQNHYNVMKTCVDRGQVKRYAHNHSKHVNSSKTIGLNTGVAL